MYEQLVRIRMVEEAIVALYPQQEMRCPTHLSVGQEAPAVGISAHLATSDLVFGGHRSHAHYLAKGGNLKAMLAELYGNDGSMLASHPAPGDRAVKLARQHAQVLKSLEFDALPVIRMQADVQNMGYAAGLAAATSAARAVRRSRGRSQATSNDGSTIMGVRCRTLIKDRRAVRDPTCLQMAITVR